MGATSMKHQMEIKIKDFYESTMGEYNVIQEIKLVRSLDPFYYKGYDITMVISKETYNIERGVIKIDFIEIDDFKLSKPNRLTDLPANIGISLINTADPGRYIYQCQDFEQSEYYSFLCKDFVFSILC
jgi:hypothetical protein